MLFKCLPPGAPIPGRFPGPAHARGKWFTIDIHCHVLTPKAAEMVAGHASATRHPREVYANERTREVNRQQAERNRIQFTSVENRLADMDLMGIDIQAISPSPNQTYYGAEPELGIATARVVNDNLAEIAGQHPDRFVPLGTVPFQAPDAAVEELERLHKSLGFRGIEIATNVGGEDLSAPRFRKIFARIEELGLLVFMHPTGFPEARRFADHYLVNVIGNPLDTTVAVHHLIFGGVLDDHPNLKLVLSHGGGYLPAYSGRIDHAASARPDTCEVIHRMPTDLSEAALFRHDRLHPSPARISGRPIRRRPCADGHRLSRRYGRGRPDRLCRESEGSRRRRTPRDPRPQRRAPARPCDPRLALCLINRKETQMLFKCLPEGASIPGRFPGPVHARGKWFTIDIHCHVRCAAAAQMTEGHEEVSRWFLETQASPRSRAINRANGERTVEQSVSPEKRIEDMDRMGIDIQAISPAPRQTYYGADPDLGIASARAINDFIAEICGRYPDRFVGLGTVPFQAPELALAELDRLTKSLGFRGIEIMTHVAGEDLSAERFRKIFARCEELGLVVFMHPDGFTEARRFADHYFANVIGNPLDSTVALHHLIFGGVLARLPQSEAGGRPWRRVLAGLFGTHRPRRFRAPRLLRADLADAVDLSEAGLFRRARLHPSSARLSGRGIRCRSHPDGYRLSRRYGRGRSSRHDRDLFWARRFRAQSDLWRQRGAAP